MTEVGLEGIESFESALLLATPRDGGRGGLRV